MKNEELARDFIRFYQSRHPQTPTAGIEKNIKTFMSGMNVKDYISPTILEEREMHVTQMDVFSRLMSDRIIFFGDEVNPDTANIVVSQLLYLSSVDSEHDITMYINSPGGHVYDGLGIIDTMMFISPKVATTCTGLAASMGSVLLACGARGKRSILPHARVMIHQPMGGINGQASDIEITAREINTLKQELYEILANRCGQPIEKIQQDADRDHWLTAVQAKEYGLVDEIHKIDWDK